MHQHEGVYATPRDQRRCGDGLAKSSRCAQHAVVVMQHAGHGSRLVWSKRARKGDINALPCKAFITDLALDAVVVQQSHGCIEATPGECDVLWEIFSAADHAGLVPNRKAHRLRPVKLRVLKSGETDQAVGQ